MDDARVSMRCTMEFKIHILERTARSLTTRAMFEIKLCPTLSSFL